MNLTAENNHSDNSSNLSITILTSPKSLLFPQVNFCAAFNKTVKTRINTVCNELNQSSVDFCKLALECGLLVYYYYLQGQRTRSGHGQNTAIRLAADKLTAGD
jgi:hypothetical protein